MDAAGRRPMIAAPVVLKADWMSQPVALDFGDLGVRGDVHDAGVDGLGVAR
jgi:hypothetical protein